MCWNAEVSLQSFIIGILSICIGFLFNVPIPLLFFCMTIVLMQLIEYIVWTNYENKEINKKASIAAIGVLFLQPIASIMTLQMYKLPMLISYLILSIFSLFLFPETDLSMERAENGHLAWNWLHPTPQTILSLTIYFIFLFVPLLLNKNFELLFIALLTLTASLYSYLRYNTWGSMWCWIVNLLVPGVIGYSIVK